MNKKLIAISSLLELILYLDLPNDVQVAKDALNKYEIGNVNSMDELKYEMYTKNRVKLYQLDTDDTMYNSEDTYGVLITSPERSQGLNYGYLLSYKNEDSYNENFKTFLTSISSHTPEVEKVLDSIDENPVQTNYWRVFIMDYLSEVLGYKFIDFNNG